MEPQPERPEDWPSAPAAPTPPEAWPSQPIPAPAAPWPGPTTSGAPTPGIPWQPPPGALPPAGAPPGWGPPPTGYVGSTGFADAEPGPPVRWGCGDIFSGLGLWLLGTILFTVPVIVIMAATSPAGAAADAVKAHDDLYLGIAGIAGLVGGWVGMVGWMLYASKHKGRGTLRDDFGFTAKWIDLAIGIGSGFAVIFASAIAAAIVAAAFGGETVSNTEQILGGSGSTVVTYILVLGAVVGAPIVEELFFRGLTLRALDKRFGPAVAVIGSTLLFAVLHWQVGSWRDVITLIAGIAVMGATFALLAMYTKRLGPAIIAHMTVNGTASLAFLLTASIGH